MFDVCFGAGQSGPIECVDLRSLAPQAVSTTIGLVVGQPASSRLFTLPGVREQFMDNTQVRIPMGKLGSRTWQPTLLTANQAWVRELKREVPGEQIYEG